MAVRVEELPALIEAGFGVSVQLGRETGINVKVAVTVWAAFIVTAQLPVPEQPPPAQPAKLEPVAAVALNVTLVPEVKFEVQVLPQLIPAGLLVTMPEPVPFALTESENVLEVIPVVKDRAAGIGAQLMLFLAYGRK